MKPTPYPQDQGPLGPGSCSRAGHSEWKSSIPKGSLGLSMAILAASASSAFAVLPDSLTLTVDVDGNGSQETTLNLYKRSVRAPGIVWYRYDTPNSTYTADTNLPEVRTYRGTVAGDPNTRVFAVIYPDGTIRAEAQDFLVGRNFKWEVKNQNVSSQLDQEGPATPNPTRPEGGITEVPIGVDLTHHYITSNNGNDIERAWADMEYAVSKCDGSHGRDIGNAVSISTLVTRENGEFYDMSQANDLGKLLGLTKNAWMDAAYPLRNATWEQITVTKTSVGGLGLAGVASQNCVGKIEAINGRNPVGVDVLNHEVGGHGWNANHSQYGEDAMRGGDNPNYGAPNKQRMKVTQSNKIADGTLWQPNGDYPDPVHPSTDLDLVTTTVDQAVTISPLANDTDANGDTLSLLSFTATTANGGTVTKSGNNLTYTPAEGYVGKDIIAYTVQDDSTASLKSQELIFIEVVNQGLTVHYTMDEVTGNSLSNTTALGHGGKLLSGSLQSGSVDAPVGKGQRLANGGIIVDDTNILPIAHTGTGSDFYPFDEEAMSTGNFFDPMDRDFSIAAWVRTTGEVEREIFSKYQSDEQNTGFRVYTENGKLKAAFREFEGMQSKLTLNAGNFSADEWHHVALVFNRSTDQAEIYLDGALAASEPLTSGSFIFHGRSPLILGADSMGDVSMDDFRIYTSALDAAGLVGIMENAKFPPAAPVPANTSTENLAAIQTLRWKNVEAQNGYRVYFGTDAAAVASATTASPEYQGVTGANWFDVGTLDTSQTYYWRVEAVWGGLTKSSEVWSFTTEVTDAAMAQGAYATWLLDETSGTTAADASGNDRDGTLSGGPVWTTDGMRGGALHFDGVDDRVSHALASTQSMSAYSVALWMKSDISRHPQYASIFNNDSSGDDFQIDYKGDRASSLRFNSSSSMELYDANKNWTHFCVVADGNEIRAYANGKLVNTLSGHAGGDFGSLKIGVNRGLNAFFNGTIDDVRVWNRAISTGEIARLNSKILVAKAGGNTDFFDESNWKTQLGGYDAAAATLDPSTGVSSDLMIDGASFTNITGNVDLKWNALNLKSGTLSTTAYGLSYSNKVKLTGGTFGFKYLSSIKMSVTGATNLTLTGGGNPVNGSSIDFITPFTGELCFTNETVSSVTSEHLSKFTVNGDPAVLDENIEIVSENGNTYVRLLTPAANLAPTLAGDNFQVTENAIPGTVLGSVTGADPDDGSLTYVITSGDPEGVFAIDEATGEISVAGMVDYETATSHALTVTALDEGGLAATALVNIAVSDVANDDSDGDGLTDEWEVEHFGSIAAVDGTADSDGDGLSDAEELAAGTDPNAADSDGDGYSDYLELAEGSDPTQLGSVPNMGGGTGLVGYWKLDDATGLLAADALGLSDGDLLNGPSWTTGMDQGALSFDGIDDKVTIPALHLNSNTVTISGWLKREGHESFAGVVFCRGGSTVSGLHISNNELKYHWNGSKWGWSSGLVLPDGVWTYVALVVEADKATIYMNDGTGMQSATNVSNHDVEAFDADLILGQDISAESRYFNGSMDDIRIYSRSLSAAEITAIFEEDADLNAAPVATDSTFTVPENAAAGTSVGTVSATDSDAGDTLSYSITAGNAGGEFAIDANTGEITTTTALDYEAASQYVLTVEVSDGELTDTATVTVDVSNVNEAPVANNLSASVSEDAAVGTSVGTVASSDPDAGDSAAYAIIAGNDGSFAINSATGEITTAAGLDFETTASYSLTVEVTDGAGLSDTASVSIAVTDVANDDSDSDGLADEWELANFGSVSSTDGSSDSDGDGLDNASELAAGSDPNMMDSDGDGYSDNVEVIHGTDPMDGLSVPAQAPLVYWRLDDASGTTAQDASGWLHDGTLSGGTVWTAAAVEGGGASFDGVDDRITVEMPESNLGAFTVAFWVKNGAAGQPVYDSVFSNHTPNTAKTFQIDMGNGFQYRGSQTKTFGAAPVGEWVHLAVVSDGTDTTLYYNGVAVQTLAGVNDDLFDSVNLGVNRNEGSFFEGEVDEFYLFEEALSQQDLLDLTGITLNAAPTASDDTFSVNENAAAGTSVGTVIATDPDAGDILAYAIVAGNAGGEFAIDAATGEITTTTTLDYETASQYVLSVEVTDSGLFTDTATITVNVTNVNEAPVANDASGSVAENAAVGTSVATVTSSDVDAADSVSYAITAGNDGSFAIDSATGVITTTAALDYETANSYALSVTVTDAGGLNDTATVAVNVTNVNEAPVANSVSASVAEDSPVGTTVATVSSTDPDAGDSVSYAITAGNDGSFAINSSTGEITLASMVDYETTNSYALTVTATDAGGLTGSASVSVMVTDVAFEDYDSDSLDDNWEIANFGDTTSSDGTGDADNDGLTDAEEYLAGSDPNSNDGDSDGFHDVLEIKAGTDPMDSLDFPASSYAGLEGWWSLDESAGSTAAVDNSGNALHAQVKGASFSGTEASFDGVDDYISTDPGLMNNLGAFTMSGWYRSGLTNGSRIGLWGQNDVIEFGINGNSLRVWTAGGGNASASIPAANQWHHVVVVGDGSSLKIYIDGVLAGSGGNNTTSYGSSPYSFNIGGGGIWDSSGNSFTGEIKDVRVYYRAVDITEFYPSSVSAEPTPSEENVLQGLAEAVLASTGSEGSNGLDKALEKIPMGIRGLQNGHAERDEHDA
ncbi:Cadherin domain-containing protein [Rubritalea squalenifaciens DSM 18772]|uniref:Cadherin domain-containing protein n=1 Tax=Rubritalea squalenifaciens DSM 18772 TaxID=1123071 RepID=A0A1M6BN73_9BACT|nr:cadherin domain-containing protein [Rubritalea squalenifaciens]SHI50114.1 Cadherin domain-containing protein [Rubritalea squalenifaciens DSM 18772]